MKISSHFKFCQYPILGNFHEFSQNEQFTNFGQILSFYFFVLYLHRTFNNTTYTNTWPVCVLLELGKICHIIAAEFRCLMTYVTLLYFTNHTTSPSPHVQTTLQAPPPMYKPHYKPPSPHAQTCKSTRHSEYFLMYKFCTQRWAVLSNSIDIVSVDWPQLCT